MLDGALCDLQFLNFSDMDASLSGFKRSREEAKRPSVMTAKFKSNLNFRDNINLWYVAVTRARKLLSLPRKFGALIELMLSVARYQNRYQSQSKLSCWSWPSFSPEMLQQIPPTPQFVQAVYKLHQKWKHAMNKSEKEEATNEKQKGFYLSGGLIVDECLLSSV